MAFDELLSDAGLERVTDASMTSFRRFGLSFALDHLYVRGFAVRSVGVERSATASDHQPVWPSSSRVSGTPGNASTKPPTPMPRDERAS